MIEIEYGAAVCEEAKLEGEISISTGTIVHPGCHMNAHTASIRVGERCVLEDRVLVHASADMIIGSDNMIESGSVLRCVRMGNANWIEPNVELQDGSVVGDNCTIGTGVVIAAKEQVPDNTIMVCISDGDGNRTRVVREQKDYLQRAHQTTLEGYRKAFMDSKSQVALMKHHRLLPSSSKDKVSIML